MTTLSLAGRAGASALLAGIGLLALAPAGHAAVTVAPGYTLTTFAPPSATNTLVDSLEVYGGNVFIGYSNGVPSDGTGGSAASTVAEYTTGGLLENTFSVVGGNDGLRVNPNTGQLWVLQNQDGNANLRIIDPNAGLLPTVYSYTPSTYQNPSYSGFDDLVFSGGTAYLSATNPASGADPVIYKASAALPAPGGTIDLTPILSADLNGKVGGTNTLVDTDSLAITPGGSLLLNDQGNTPLGASQPLPSLTLVTNPGAASQATSQLFPTVAGKAVSTDDTRFAPAGAQTLLIADGSGASDTVYALTGAFAANAAFTATKGSSFVGSLDMGTGAITPLVSGLTSPHGLAFIPPAAAVPEPSALALLGLPLAGLLLAARRRRAA